MKRRRRAGWCALPLSIIQPRRLRGTPRARLAAHRVRRHISPIIPTFLSDAIFWLAAACCVFAQAAIVRSALRARAQRPDGSASPSRPIEVAWTVVPGIVLALVLVLTWRALHPAATLPTVP
jgi:heme/copper-type cytochrome/quinol oxidase subunit 2